MGNVIEIILKEKRRKMSTTKSNKIGKIRTKLAEQLAIKLQGLIINPEDLHSQYPIYASAKFDSCSWYCDIENNGESIHIYSYFTMKQCINNDFTLHQNNDFSYEVILK